MRHFLLLCVLVFSASLAPAFEPSPVSPQRLNYDEPADHWMKALPIGNGSLGAMVYGGVGEDRYKLNHDTFWSGKPTKWNVDIPDDLLERIDAHMAAGEVAQANELLREMQGPFNQSYQPLGDLVLTWQGLPAGDGVTFARELRLETAEATTHISSGTRAHERRAYSSYPDQVIVLELAASGGQTLDFTARVESPAGMAKSRTEGEYLILRSKAPKHVDPNYFNRKERTPVLYDDWGGEGMEAETWVRVVMDDGEVTVADGKVSVEGATRGFIVIAAGTTFVDRFTAPDAGRIDEVGQQVKARVDGAVEKGQEALWQRHLGDYQKLYERSHLYLGGGAEDVSETDKLLESYAKERDQKLVALLYNYGRYLLIASSREGSQPSNLQGIWSEKVRPAWSSNYTLNINAEMNYWPADITQLGETAQPFFAYVRDLARNGKVTATELYRAPGWVSHHNGDIWAQSAPVGHFGQGDPRWANWKSSNAWLCQHIYEHYLFTGDLEFLERYYPVLRGAAEFWRSQMWENEAGLLEMNWNTSPENIYALEDGTKVAISRGPGMDLALAYEIFSNTRDAARALRDDLDFADELETLVGKLQPLRIGKDGRILEWDRDVAEPEPEHRHISHLYALHPGSQITESARPALFEAARKSLIGKGDEATGWSMGWKINLWARLKDGDHANQIIDNLLRPVDPNAGTSMTGGGLYPNLLDAHPPFQIDGNFGYTAGVVEMLVQSHVGVVELLPALPSEWAFGMITGVHTRGGFLVDLEWAYGDIRKVTITSTLGGALDISAPVPLEAEGNLRTGGDANPLLAPRLGIATKKDVAAEQVPPENFYRYQTEKGQVIVLTRRRD